jgi:hypothetical protein
MSPPRRRSVVVTRDYRPAPDNCTQALALLLKKSVRTKATEPAPESDSRDTYEKLANEERSQDDLSENAFLGAEGDRTEQTRKDTHGFVHR